MKKSERYYLAGLLEGEGSFVAHMRSDRLNSINLTICCDMTDIEPLEKLLQFCQGHLYGPYTTNGVKVKWRWSVTQRNDVLRILNAIYPLMSPRRKEQIETLLRLDRIYPLQRKAYT